MEQNYKMMNECNPPDSFKFSDNGTWMQNEKPIADEPFYRVASKRKIPGEKSGK